MSNTKGKEAAEHLTNFINTSSGQERAQFVGTIMREHRQLQHEVFQLMMLTMEGWAQHASTGHYDPRNKFAVETSYNIMKALGHIK